MLEVLLAHTETQVLLKSKVINGKIISHQMFLTQMVFGVKEI
jgi:hypothetical protein